MMKQYKNKINSFKMIKTKKIKIICLLNQDKSTIQTFKHMIK